MEEQNPWWYGEEDYEYEKWRSFKVKWVPVLIDEIELKPFSLHLIVGPRQVGKTTAIKILIQRLLKNRNAKSIFYFSCEELTDYRELGEIIDTYVSARDEWGIKSSTIFLDEITFVDEWWRALKLRIDKGVFRNDVVIVTGSASLELLQQKEYFPGRRGYGKDFYFLPLDFAEYVRIFGKLRLRSSVLSDPHGVDKAMRANMVFKKKLFSLFMNYVKTGGFPVPIKEFYERGKISLGCKKVYLDWLRSDWAKIGMSNRYMKEVITYVLRAKLTPVSWLSIARETSINSPHTTQSYVESMEKLFVFKVCYIISPDFRVLYRKNKKIHVTDPFLYSTLSHYTGVDVLEEQVVESILACHISRVTNVFFWKNGKEVDVVGIIGNEQVGFEVKWGVGTWVKPKHLKKVFLLKKENLPVFLASIDWKKL